MKISVLAFQDCMTSAVFGLMDAFAIATSRAPSVADPRWRRHTVQIVTRAGDPVQGFGNYLIAGHASYENSGDSDVVIVPPVFGDVEAALQRERAAVTWLAGFRSRNAIVASTCTGAFFLAEAGLIKGLTMTTNPAYGSLFARRYPAIRVAVEQKIVESPTVISAGSTTAFLDLAVRIVDRLGGHELAVLTAKALSIDKNPGSQLPYSIFVAPKDHGDRSIVRLQDWIESNYARPIGRNDIAAQGAMSLRSLNRRFRLATRLAPSEYLRAVRIENAKRLLEQGDTAVDRVAFAVGYADSRSFIRAFGTLVGRSPGAYRRRFKSAGFGTMETARRRGTPPSYAA